MSTNKSVFAFKTAILKDCVFSDVEIDNINALYTSYKMDGGDVYKLLRHVKKLNGGNVSLENFDDFVLRIKAIDSLGRDSSTLKSYQLRYGDEHGYLLWVKKTESTTNTREQLIAKFGESYSSVLKLRGACLDTYIIKHGVEVGTKKWNAYLDNRKAAYAKNRDDNYQYAKYTREYYINLYGEAVGGQKFDNKIEKQRYKVSKQRYLDEFGDLGADICRDVKDTNSLKAYIERHGEIDGQTLYYAAIAARSKPIVELCKIKYGDSWEEAYARRKNNHFVPTLANYIKKYGEVAGIERHSLYKASLCVGQKVSNISVEMFDLVKKQIPDLCWYGNAEQTIMVAIEDRLKYNRSYVTVDCLYGNKIIEFNGDTFHGNPMRFSQDDQCHPYDRTMLVGSMWKADKLRCDFLTDRGYEVLYVWESDYKKYKMEVVDRCVKFLTR